MAFHIPRGHLSCCGKRSRLASARWTGNARTHIQLAKERTSQMASQHAFELAAGDRFAFGKNWRNYLTTVDQDQLNAAVRSIQDLMDVVDLRGKTFLDIGSGSGLFSLAARRLGAHVHSFDFDPKSVACTRELRKNYFGDDDSWKIQEASALDTEF